MNQSAYPKQRPQHGLQREAFSTVRFRGESGFVIDGGFFRGYACSKAGRTKSNLSDIRLVNEIKEEDDVEGQDRPIIFCNNDLYICYRMWQNG